VKKSFYKPQKRGSGAIYGANKRGGVQMLRKILSLSLSFSLLFQCSGFAQSINLADYLSQSHNPAALDRFRPVALRYFSYDPSADNFKILLDKGDQKDLSDTKIKDEAERLLTYFKIGLSLPNEKFWVNLRPDAEDQIIDPELEKTDLGKALLEADLQLKKDTSSLTSPQTKEGKEYWNKLYKKAGELFGSENIIIPTLTRPWIVPGEIIVRESGESAYIYKATLKVLLEQDHLRGSVAYNFSDPRMKELNEYSSQLIRELILPGLTKRINSSKDYANLRQVFFSLILARWFKDSFRGKNGEYSQLIDSGNLSNLTSKEPWSKTDYFNQYRKSFQDGEYNLSEKVYASTGQVIRRYTSGGMNELMTFAKESFVGNSSPVTKESMVSIIVNNNNPGVQLKGLLEKYESYANEGKLSGEEKENVKKARELFNEKDLLGAANMLQEIALNNRKYKDKGGWGLYGSVMEVYGLLEDSSVTKSNSGSPLELKAELLAVMNKHKLSTKELENKQNVAGLKELIEKMFHINSQQKSWKINKMWPDLKN